MIAVQVYGYLNCLAPGLPVANMKQFYCNDKYQEPIIESIVVSA